jgi:putative transposase
MCSVFGVSTSGYYSWKNRDNSNKEQKVYELKRKIEDVFTGSRKTYGAPRVFQVLKGLGLNVGKCTVARMMRDMGLMAKTKRRFKVKTTDSNHQNPISPNILEQNFDVEKPSTVWLSDITYVETGEGWLYVFSIMDLCTRKIVGWSFADSLSHEAALESLEMALKRQKYSPGLIFHTDRGVQYTCEVFRKKLQDIKFIQSMSRKGNCYDNAPMESFFHTFKTELVYQTTFQTKEDARTAIFEWIEEFYNRQRIHSSIGYKSPVDYEEALMLNLAA